MAVGELACRRHRRRCRRRPGRSVSRRAANSSGVSDVRPPRPRWATARRASVGSTTMIGDAPAARKTATKRQPIAPAPKMTADSPGRGFARLAPLTTQARGSMSAATSAVGSSAIGIHRAGGRLGQPGQGTVSEDAERLDVLAVGRPAGAAEAADPALRDPDRRPPAGRPTGRRRDAAGPSRATRPMNSWPMTTPGSAGWPGGTFRICRSVPQMPHASTSMMTSSSASTVGSGTSSRRTTPSPWKTAARIRPPPRARDRGTRRRAAAGQDERRDAEDQQGGDEHDRGHGVDLGRDAELDPACRCRSAAWAAWPIVNQVMTNSSIESVTLISAPAMIAGAISGRTMWRMAWRGDAPRSAAAHSSARSKPCSRAATMSTTNGTVTTSCPATTVPSDSGRCSGAREEDQQRDADQHARHHDRQGEARCASRSGSGGRRGRGRRRPSSR